jgi:ElaB/YqjD/DUF883 family membrane-anchored ribosome-binding protein
MDSKPKSFSTAIEELEKLAGDKGQKVKDRLISEIEGLEEQFEQLKPKLEQIKQDAEQQLGKAKDKVEQQVKEHPWVTLSLVGLLAFVLGFIFRGGRSRE